MRQLLLLGGMSTVSQHKKTKTRTRAEGQARYSKFAKKIVNDALRLRPGENLTIEAWEHELDFAKEIKLQARKIGANVLLIVEDDMNYFDLAERGFEKSL